LVIEIPRSLLIFVFYACSKVQQVVDFKTLFGSMDASLAATTVEQIKEYVLEVWAAADAVLGRRPLAVDPDGARKECKEAVRRIKCRYLYRGLMCTAAGRIPNRAAMYGALLF